MTVSVIVALRVFMCLCIHLCAGLPGDWGGHPRGLRGGEGDVWTAEGLVLLHYPWASPLWHQPHLGLQHDEKEGNRLAHDRVPQVSPCQAPSLSTHVSLLQLLHGCRHWIHFHFHPSTFLVVKNFGQGYLGIFFTMMHTMSFNVKFSLSLSINNLRNNVCYIAFLAAVTVVLPY